MSSSLVPRLAGLATLIVAASLPRSEPARVIIVADVKPKVAVQVNIDTGYYREYLGDPSCSGPCDRLRAVIVADVRDLLATRYPFLDWTDGDASDTVQISFANTPGFSLATQLDFRILGPTRRMALRAKSVPFEERGTLLGRPDEAWTPESLRVAWLKQLREQTFTPSHPDLVADVFGRIPLRARVSFASQRALVSASPDEISRAAMPPVYQVRVLVHDTVNQIDDVGDVPLMKCELGIGHDRYSCAIEQLWFARDTLRSDRLAPLLERNAVAPQEVFVANFVVKDVDDVLSRGPTSGIAP